MTKLIIDAGLSQKLAGAGGEVELCDENGRTLGVFVPAPPTCDDRVYSEAREALTREQIDMAIEEPGGRSLEEILKDLQRH
jgi:hypothetical protein